MATAGHLQSIPTCGENQDIACDAISAILAYKQECQMTTDGWRINPINHLVVAKIQKMYGVHQSRPS